jgi:hypothetical protein
MEVAQHSFPESQKYLLIIGQCKVRWDTPRYQYMFYISIEAKTWTAVIDAPCSYEFNDDHQKGGVDFTAKQ